MNTIKDIAMVLSAALAPITAIVALSLAYAQHRLEKVKVRQQLYERRLAIFSSTMHLLAMVMRDANVQTADLFKFSRETDQSYFLLGKDITDYLDEIYKKGIDLYCQTQTQQNSSLPVAEERTRLAEQKGELVKWFGRQLLVARERFAPHLRLDK
jgi:hypothetical protein